MEPTSYAACCAAPCNCHLQRLAFRTFTLDGEPYDVLAAAASGDLWEEELRRADRLAPGDRMYIGGAAGTVFTLRCEGAQSPADVRTVFLTEADVEAGDAGIGFQLTIEGAPFGVVSLAEFIPHASYLVREELVTIRALPPGAAYRCRCAGDHAEALWELRRVAR